MPAIALLGIIAIFLLTLVLITLERSTTTTDADLAALEDIRQETTDIRITADEFRDVRNAVADLLRKLDAYDHGDVPSYEADVVSIRVHDDSRDLDFQNKADREWLRRTLSA